MNGAQSWWDALILHWQKLELQEILLETQRNVRQTHQCDAVPTPEGWKQTLTVMWLFGKRNERFLAGRLCSVVSREDWICHRCHCYLVLWDNASFFPSKQLQHKSAVRENVPTVWQISVKEVSWEITAVSVTERHSVKLSNNLMVRH